jgi:pantoate--beta-alanine ligase
LESCQCDLLFHPDAAELYPHGLDRQSLVTVPELGQDFCGKSRPGHFEGVSTVVAKLFNLCQPDQAFFGLKDYQQYLVVRRMVDDLHFPVWVTGVETEREADGLAMSSRNNYLSVDQRALAPAIHATLVATASRIEAGENDFSSLEEKAQERLVASQLRPDYFAVSNANTLQRANVADRELVILAAAYLGKTRLIDNIRLTLKDPL